MNTVGTTEEQRTIFMDYLQSAVQRSLAASILQKHMKLFLRPSSRVPMICSAFICTPSICKVKIYKIFPLNAMLRTLNFGDFGRGHYLYFPTKRENRRIFLQTS